MPIQIMTYIDGGGKPIEVRDYFVEPKDVTWDGIGPLKLDLAKIIESARAYILEQYKSKAHFESLQLTSDDSDPKARQFYYLKLTFATRGRNARTMEIYADLRGRVIRPEIHRFKSNKEYHRFAKERGLLMNNLPERW